VVCNVTYVTQKIIATSSAIVHSNIGDLEILQDNETGAAPSLATAAVEVIRKIGRRGFTTALRDLLTSKVVAEVVSVAV